MHRFPSMMPSISLADRTAAGECRCAHDSAESHVVRRNAATSQFALGERSLLCRGFDAAYVAVPTNARSSR